MNPSNVLAHLEAMRQKYQEVRELTDKLTVDSSDEEFQSAAARRSDLLLEIQQHQYELNTTSEGWKKSFSGNGTIQRAAEQVQVLILRIVSKDKSVQQILRDRMTAIKKDLQNLGTRSRATMAYAGNIR